MGFYLVCNKVAADIYVGPDAWPGVLRVAGVLADDIALVSGVRPRIVRDAAQLSKRCIIVGTAGRTCGDPEGLFADCAGVEGSREVFTLRTANKPLPNVEEALVIYGSDKRGTIYGMFEASRRIGVTPWVWFADAAPAKCAEPVLPGDLPFVSKEPSIRYRGFFINDEWPSFGNWTTNLFGGFNAKMYEQVFLLLLRMKGNYLWPAMWSAIFPNDGPGLANAELADELGVVMGASHHEPCCRQGEEYKYLRGKDSVYGDAWNFLTNEEGITRFWADGLARSGRFENVITVGMRGEADSTILGHESTLADNIDLLRRVLRTQNKLIREHVNEDLSKVPRMLALYKEVEPFFYGDAKTPGLMGEPELEGVTLMFCEDNYGNMRTLPSEALRNHNGGFGMYYHFDYHGGPVSYEWVNSTQLSKVWEQMGRAYAAGIRDIWIVNVGDLKPQEYPLTYFMDLAYDFEKYGTRPNETVEYTQHFTADVFAGGFEECDRNEAFRRISETLLGYSALNAQRRPETLHPMTYCLSEESEAARMLAACRKLRENCEWLASRVRPELADCLFELVTYPATASANLVEMMIAAAANEALLSEENPRADVYADLVADRIREDEELAKQYHTIAGGKWNGMMSGKHIGFKQWNDEGSGPPAVHRLAEVKNGTYLPDQIPYPRVDFREEHLSTDGTTNTWEAGMFGLAEKKPERPDWAAEHFSKNTYIMNDAGVVAMDAAQYAERRAAGDASYEILEGYGRHGSAAAVLPLGRDFAPAEGPQITYRFAVPKKGRYYVRMLFAPNNPKENGGGVRFGYSLDGSETVVTDLIPKGFRSGDCFNPAWCFGVMINARMHMFCKTLPAGVHTLTVSAVDSEAVLERIVITKKRETWANSYLGPQETYHE
ncbi:MAG: glycosyl hydrolase 115 family protein [Lachnospiraceae bacterium]|nr:glycosyl hydrolase 115 family protein [Lachnospiraceae bacterium]